MIRVPGDAPDAPFSVTLGTVTDSEGSTVPTDGFSWNDPTTDNDTAVTFVDVLNEGQKVSGKVRFGKPNDDGSPSLANLNVELKNADGVVVLNKALSVEVSAGAPVNFTGDFVIEGHPDEA